MYISNGKNPEAWKEKTLLSECRKECPLLYEGVSDFMCLVDSNFVLRGISPSVEQISGHKSEKLTGKTIQEANILRPKSMEEALSVLKDTFSTGRAGERKVEFVNKDGGENLYIISSYPIIKDDDRVDTALFIVREAINRRESEICLTCESCVLNRIIKNDANKIMVLNKNGQTVFISKRVREIIGLPKENDAEIRHNTSENYFADFDGVPVPDERMPFNQVMDAGKAVYGMRFVSNQDTGRQVFLEVSGAPLMDESGEIEGVVLNFDDITAYQNIAGDLQIRNDAIETSINAIAFADLQGNINYVNQSFLEMSKYDSKEDIFGKPLFMFAHNEREAKRILDKLLKSEDWIGDLVARRKDGSLFEVHLSATLVKDKAGEPVCVMGTFEDISENMKMQNIINQSEKLSSLGQLTAGLSHELRNPLAVISSCAQLCLDTMDLSDKLEENMKTIYQNSTKANELINGLLKFARPSEMIWRPVKINEVVKRMLRLAKMEAHSFQVTVDTHFRERMPRITGDEGKLGQVFLNLFMNAFQAVSTKGKIIIQTRALKSKGLIEVNVIDDGPGIPKEYRHKIFDPFFTTKDSGTGLGLSIAHTIVMQHKGIITSGHKKGQGTIMSVKLPIDQ